MAKFFFNRIIFFFGILFIAFYDRLIYFFFEKKPQTYPPEPAFNR